MCPVEFKLIFIKQVIELNNAQYNFLVFLCATRSCIIYVYIHWYCRILKVVHGLCRVESGPVGSTCEEYVTLEICSYLLFYEVNIDIFV